MERIDPDDLTGLAFGVLEEAAAAAHLGPVRRTHGLGLAMAWLQLSSVSRALPNSPFMKLWDDLACERDHDRWASVNASLNAIYQLVGTRRKLEIQSQMEGEARSGTPTDAFEQAFVEWAGSRF